jgi:molybdenum cofactor guanylyltransferase
MNLSAARPLTDVTGVVLAGGASRRMGRDKATLMIAGELLLARVVRRLRAATSEVMVIGPPERERLVPGVDIVPDAYRGMGPLGGICTALQVARTSYVFVVACDMPFVSPDVVRHLASLSPNYDIVVPRSERGREPLHAIYAAACFDTIVASLNAGDLAVADLFQRARTRVVEAAEWATYDPEGLSMFNANTPDDWERACMLAGAGQ